MIDVTRSPDLKSQKNRAAPGPLLIYLLKIIPCFLITISVAYADALGLPASTARVGYGFGTARTTFDDPVASSNDAWAKMPVILILTDWIPSGQRYWADLRLSEAVVEARAGRAGQIVRMTGLGLSLQTTLGIFQGWSPWVGAGVRLNRVEYKKRHTADADGYLLERYPDSHENNLGLVLNIMGEGKLGPNLSLGAGMEQSYVLNNANRQLTFNILALYRF